jgi:hypothetical protein
MLPGKVSLPVRRVNGAGGDPEALSICAEKAQTFRYHAMAFIASCPVSLSHKSLYSKLIATLDRTTTNIDGTP